MKGADTDIKDKKGNIPVFYTKDIENEEDADNIKNILQGQKKSVGDILTGNVPIHKLKRNRKNLFLFYFVFWLVVSLKVITTFSRMNWNWVIPGISIDVLTFMFHVILSFTDPGFIENDGIEFIKLLEVFDPQ